MKRALLFFSLFLPIVPAAAFAESVPGEITVPGVGHRDLTPSERIARGASSGVKPHSEKYIKLSTYYDAGIADESLADRVLAALRGDPALAERPIRLKVASKNRTVRLEGVVNDEAERTLVAERAAAVTGVDKVENSLRIKRSDRDLLED